MLYIIHRWYMLLLHSKHTRLGVESLCVFDSALIPVRTFEEPLNNAMQNGGCIAQANSFCPSQSHRLLLGPKACPVVLLVPWICGVASAVLVKLCWLLFAAALAVITSKFLCWGLFQAMCPWLSDGMLGTWLCCDVLGCWGHWRCQRMPGIYLASRGL